MGGGHGEEETQHRDSCAEHREVRACRGKCYTDLTCSKLAKGCVSAASAHPCVASCQVDSSCPVADLSLAPPSAILEWTQLQHINIFSAGSPCHSARADSGLWAVKSQGPVSSQEASRKCLVSQTVQSE